MRAACRAEPAEAAFGTAKEQAEFIRLYCRRCSVRRPCLEFGVRLDGDGVYGGMTRRERAAAGLVPKAAERRRGTRSAPQRRTGRMWRCVECGRRYCKPFSEHGAPDRCPGTLVGEEAA